MKKNSNLSVNNLLWYITIFVLVLIIDRATKLFALVNDFVNYPVFKSSGIGGLEFDLVFNRGMSWGMLDSKSTLIFVSVSTFICFVTLVMATYGYFRLKAGHTIFGEVIVVAGSISNILDRIFYGGVIDFIVFSCDCFPRLGRLSFPVFNLADAFIFLGVLVITVNIWRKK